MQDPDIPPAVVEGEASGDAGVVRGHPFELVTSQLSLSEEELEEIIDFLKDPQKFQRQIAFNVFPETPGTRFGTGLRGHEGLRRNDRARSAGLK